ncbi:MAG TPA: hemerythrin domain-containing protein [Myxococcota bacterium]|nr:hemerythrin domain-containing protein [Myxococcota bacterium]
MSFCDVRLEILQEHRGLRLALATVEALCVQLEGGDPEAAQALLHSGRALYQQFAAHLNLEDQILLPTLEAVAGSASASQLAAEHREQRELLGYLLGRMAYPGRPALLLARELRQFAALVREDMREEEETLLVLDAPAERPGVADAFIK